MGSKRQFKGGYKPRSFFDRKVRPSGNTRILSIGKIIPKGWQYVRLKIVSKGETHVTVRIIKLYGEEPNPRSKATRKASQQNTSKTRATTRH